MIINDIGGESRKLFIDTVQIYEQYIFAIAAVQQHKGGMRWKKTNATEYLFKTRGGGGYGKSLGVRSKETENIFEQFQSAKKQASLRLAQLEASIKRQARFNVAAGINRVPNITANIIRLLDQEGLMGRTIKVLGTNAMYAYEAAAGIRFETGLLATGDIDLLFDADTELKLSAETKETGLIGILQRVDPTFKVIPKGHFRAANANGFLVELVKAIPNPEMKIERKTISANESDLVAAEMNGFAWLKNSPVWEQTVIAVNGYPLRMHCPDPRFYAINKLWTSELKNRNPIKRPRDRMQAEAITYVAEHYLNLSFDDTNIRVFPGEIINRFMEVKAEMSISSRFDQ